jgi:membrane fusion protein (multidrug efflux system)
VTRVGTESDTGQLSGGVVRVELAVDPPADPRIELQHGMQAEVEVEVARVSPLDLLLRALGEWRNDNPPEPPAPPPQGSELANAAPDKP